MQGRLTAELAGSVTEDGVANTMVRPASTRGSTTRSVRWQRAAVLDLSRWQGAGWCVAALVVIVAVGRMQAGNRSPLTWDEASRVDGGAMLDFALSSLSPERVWTWLTSIELPFVAPALHGIVLAFAGDAAAATWLPSATALAAAGVLSARLARSLGTGTGGAWVAAVVVWATPIGVRLAGGAFTENLGSCALTGTVLALCRLERAPSRVIAVAAGGVVALAWWTSPDYGLTALAFVVAAMVVPTGPRTRRFHLLATTTALALAGLHVIVTGSSALAARDLWGVLDQRTLGEVDLYYPRAMFDARTFAGAELGLAPVVAGALLLGTAWAVAGVRRRPNWRLPVLSLAVWLAMYAPSATKGARFVALILPVLAALAVTGVRDLTRADRRSQVFMAAAAVVFALIVVPEGVLVLRLLPLVAAVALIAFRPALVGARRVAGAAATGAVVVLIGLQIVGQLSGLGDQLWFVERNPPAERAFAFITEHLPEDGRRPILMIGASTALSPRLVQLAWNRRLGQGSAGVRLVPEAGSPYRARQLVETLADLQPALVVSVRTGARSRVAPERNPSGREVLPSQRDYAQLAVEMAERGSLVPVASLVLEDDPVRIDVWRPGPGP